MTWVIKDTGLLVPPQDASALAQALQQMIANPSSRLRLGNAGRQRFEYYFEIQPVARKISQLYRQVLERYS
jgi:glycosyltransferase involved in cell wall biosynthesis